MANKKSSFKGLEVSEMNFDRSIKKCSEVVENSCGIRDCTLEVYKLGDDLILSGGLCPKGNTTAGTKKAPDYIRMYLNILEEHLKKISNKIESPRTGKTILYIPRSMTFLNEKGIFYTSVYYHLGFDIRISPESNEEISNLGKLYSHSEFCYPLILAHGHAAYLKNKMKESDKILLVNVIGTSKEKYKFCPYVASAGHVISGNLDLEMKNVLLPVIRFEDPDYPIYKAIKKDIERVFPNKFSENEIKEAINKAEKANLEFLDEVHKKGEEIIKELKEKNEKIYFGIARGYTIFDPKASSEVDKLFSNNGLHFLPSYFLKSKNIDTESLATNMYWYQGRRMLEYLQVSLEDKNIFPIRLTNFNCGPDSIVHYHEERLANSYNKPWLVLETDGHNSNAQFGTRILAHNRVVFKFIENPAEKQDEKEITKNEDYENRIIGLPYMGDSCDIVSACLRNVGYNSEVIPTGTKESNEISKKIVSTNTCRPFSYQVGDQLAWLYNYKEKKVDVNKKLAIFLPTTQGPCRFGQYSSVIRHFFDERGFEGVPIISPTSTKDYLDANLPRSKVLTVTRLAFKGVLANEILYNALLRIRPYEINKGESDKLYKKSHEELIKLVEKNPSIGELKKFMIEKNREFLSIKRNDKERYPLVLVIGEIFMRTHELSNQNSIKMLEEHKLECMLEPIYSWMIYINKNVLKKSIESKNFKQAGYSFLKKNYINFVIKKLSEPFKDLLYGRESHDPFHLIHNVEEDLVYDSAVEGEGGLSIAGVYAFIKGNIKVDGIYHIGPLGCMQETIATSRSQALIYKNREKEKGNDKVIPFMDAVFGDSAIANLDSQIAIFAENCWLRKEMGKCKLNA